MEARVQAQCFTEMNIQTNEAENRFMKDKNYEIASGFDDWEVTADFNNSNFAWVEGAETNLAIESEEVSK